MVRAARIQLLPPDEMIYSNKQDTQLQNILGGNPLPLNKASPRILTKVPKGDDEHLGAGIMGI